MLWGFGLGQAREAVMFSEVSIRLLWTALPVETSINHLLPEHVLAMAAILVVAGAFIRDGLDNQESARAYLQAGALVTGAGDLTGPVPFEATGLSGPLPRELVTLDLEHHLYRRSSSRAAFPARRRMGPRGQGWRANH
ncbi:MAG: hypothetical protein KDD78_04225 [Caldilineaceae bacterium]|nr:hypothetical protein [Caldilineaceae bacterium]